MTNNVELAAKLGKRAKTNEPLSKHTFLKIGGPADVYYEAEFSVDFLRAIMLSRELGIQVTILGDGSNVLVSDKGIRGLVLVNRANEIEILESNKKTKIDTIKPEYRWESDSKVGSFKYEFKDLDYDEFDKPRILVKMDSGVDLPRAIDYLLDKGITGLQWYAGIPGTIGGAVFNNIHGGTHFISEVLNEVAVVDKNGKEITIPITQLGVDYDKSRFQSSGEIITSATFLLYKGDIKKAKYVRYEWAKRKSIQPRNAPGCAFHNLTQEQKDKLGLPTTSAGFVIEHILKLTGYSVGDAAISESHHNFIVNKGGATAKDYLAVMKNIYWRAKKELGIHLVPEIFLLGFDQEEIQEFLRPELVAIRKKRASEIKTIYKDSKKMFGAKQTSSPIE